MSSAIMQSSKEEQSPPDVKGRAQRNGVAIGHIFFMRKDLRMESGGLIFYRHKRESTFTFM